MSQNLLMIEDDARLASMVMQYLEQSGFAIQHGADGLTGLSLLSNAAPSAPIGECQTSCRLSHAANG